ncbi:hypothetical protein Pyn_20457 [Prunus yedoensis var. nudiflora]|uniref:Uncharacterized protein n=1 Tax=Prunus yedoensis var. nudiflora TaxID=2094558 RepID=A0A314YU66_PRUYE|nr:hypothetical protein Pyn_20457 [Prunus yedoensis var. nudiflora]
MAKYVSMPFVVVVAAAAAAAGIYFLDKNHYQPKELGGGIGETIQHVVPKPKVELNNTTQMLKLAPQFDGLDSFETLVAR